jgi:hypothetical protein
MFGKEQGEVVKSDGLTIYCQGCIAECKYQSEGLVLIQ